MNSFIPGEVRATIDRVRRILDSDPLTRMYYEKMRDLALYGTYTITEEEIEKLAKELKELEDD